MNLLRALFVAACAVASICWGSLASAQDDPVYVPADIGNPDTSGNGGTNQADTPLVWEDPIYVKPDIGVPKHETTGATRGGKTAPPELLAPSDHMGLTANPQPTLYWRLSQTTSQPVVFVVQEKGSVRTLVNQRLASPSEAGVHAVDLGKLEVSLQPDVDYKWSIRVVADPEKPSGDSVAEAWIRLTALTAAALDQVQKAPPDRKVNVLAEKGIWYDAIDAVSRQIEAYAGDPGPVRQRDSLLMQVKPVE